MAAVCGLDVHITSMYPDHDRGHILTIAIMFDVICFSTLSKLTLRRRYGVSEYPGPGGFLEAINFLSPKLPEDQLNGLIIRTRWTKLEGICLLYSIITQLSALLDRFVDMVGQSTVVEWYKE